MAPTLLGVAGFPVAHSRSPAMHNAALREMGLDWLYVALPLPPERFVETALSLGASGYRGINVTMPHKQAAHDLADSRTPAAIAIAAANTLTYGEDGIEADNTDAGGFLDALGADPRGMRCLVLGAGGSARAVVWALREAGAAEVTVWNRTADRAVALAAELGVAHGAGSGRADLIVNCTSVGLDAATAEDDALTALGLDGVEPPAVLCDLVYGSTTPLERWAARGGSRVVRGVDVLVHQGARSLTRWVGREPPLATMHAAAQGR